MGTRGRASSAALATAPVGPCGIEVHRRLPVPDDLGREAGEVWQAIVSGLPTDWFTPGSAPLLVQLCRHVVAARRVAGWLARIEEAADLDGDLWLRLLARQEAESKAIAALATRLRLTPQSRYTPHGAARAAGKDIGRPRPWEV